MTNSEKDKIIRQKKAADKKIITKGIILALIVFAIVISTALIVSLRTPKEVIVGAYGDELTRQEKTQAVDKLESAMERLRGKNLLLSVKDAQVSLTMLYNNKGEALSEIADTGAKTFYLNNNKTVQFSDTISYGEDSEILSILDSAIKLQKAENLPVLKKDLYDASNTNTGDTSASVSPVIEYMIDIRGWDEIHKLYEYVSSKFADAMIDGLKGSIEGIATEEGSTISSTDELNMRLTYTLVGDEIYSGACYVYFGDKESRYITESDLQINWYFEGAVEVYDWELNQDWYNTNWDNLSDSDISKVEEMFSKQYESITNMIGKFAADNGIDDPSTSNETSNTESTSDETLDNIDDTDDIDGETN